MTELEIERVFKRYYQSLYVYAMQILQDEEKSKDMVADTFEYVCKNAVHIEGNTIQSLLYTSLRSRCLDSLRHDKVHLQYAEYYRMVTRLDADTYYHEYEERTQMVEKALSFLPDRTRQILEACYVKKKKYKEAAMEFGITEHGIRKQVYKALSQLRQCIKKFE